MTRATQTLSFVLLLSSVYLLCLSGLIPFPTKIQQNVVPYLPFLGIFAFGVYTLFRLAWGVLTLRDTPDAYKELMAEIELARADLREKGVSVD